MAASEPTNASPKLVHAQWYSHSEQIYRFVDIYVPAAYEQQGWDTSSDGYLPALYLLPGIGGYEGSWQEMADAIDTLETLIASGRCKPVLLVMPDCNKWPELSRPSGHNSTLWTCMLRYPYLIHDRKVAGVLSDLIDMIDTTYCVSDCALAGLSDGARVAVHLGNLRPDRIRTVALFSPVLHYVEVPADAGQKYCLYVGERDFFYPNGERFRRRLDKADHPYEWVVFPERHNWPMWRRCLSHFLQYM